MQQEETLPTIYIDSRERPSGLIEGLRRIASINVVDRWLPYGDILIADILIERKTTADFLQSLRDGRLFRQVSALHAFSTRRLLIVEGLGFPSSQGYSESSIYGALTKIEVGMQTPIVWTNSITETAELVSRIVAQESKVVSRAAAARRDPSRRKEICPQVRAMRAIPELSTSTGRDLLHHFGSIRGVLNASMVELESVAGISPECAQTVFLFATEPPLTTSRPASSAVAREVRAK